MAKLSEAEWSEQFNNQWQQLIRLRRSIENKPISEIKQAEWDSIKEAIDSLDRFVEAYKRN